VSGEPGVREAVGPTVLVLLVRLAAILFDLAALA
jgi:hypothetical protein